MFSIFKKKEEVLREKKDLNKIREEYKGYILILGSGCQKCNDLEKNVREAMKELKLDKEIKHVSDFEEIAAYGVMRTPALVIFDKVVSYGKVLTVNEVKDIINKEGLFSNIN